MSFHCVFLLIPCFPLMLALSEFHSTTTFQNAGHGRIQHFKEFNNNSVKLLNETSVISLPPSSNGSNLTATSAGHINITRQSRSQKINYPPAPLRNNPYSTTNYNYAGEQFYNPLTLVLTEETGNTLESPFLSTRPQQGYDNGFNYEYSTEVPEETTTESSDDDEEEEEETTSTEEPTTTTTLAPFTLANVKVPAPFLRIEYMICFTFFGLMYGLGFFVLFQSLCVPAAKLAVYIVYILLLKNGVVDPVTLEQALEMLPPT